MRLRAPKLKRTTTKNSPVYRQFNSIRLLVGSSSSVNIFTCSAVPLLTFPGFNGSQDVKQVLILLCESNAIRNRHIVKSLSSPRDYQYKMFTSIWILFSFVIQHSLGRFMCVCRAAEHYQLKYSVRCPQCAL